MRSVFFAFVLSTLFFPAHAQDAWPTRPVRLLVPSAPGGGADTVARLLAPVFAEALKQQFVVENRTGAGGIIGTDLVAKAPPDGYTFLLSPSTAVAINPSLYKNLPYDMERDFAPVARSVNSPGILVSHPSIRAKTLADLVALGKREQGKLGYGTGGQGAPGNLLVKMLESASGTRFLQVQYKGLGQALLGLLGGEVAFALSDVGSALSYVRSGRLAPLAVTSRTPLFPNTLAFAEQGYPTIDTYISFMLFAPAKTSPAIVRRLSTETNAALKSPAVKTRLDNLGYVPVLDTPEEFAAGLRKERHMWAEVIQRNKITVD